MATCKGGRDCRCGVPSPKSIIATCQYHQTDDNPSVLTLRRASYGEFAFAQEGHYRSVYLTRAATIRLAFRILRAALLP